ncbi:MAG TPA: hypothetical protein VIU65_05505, partial [Pyrinomonadaceae bacterium]
MATDTPLSSTGSDGANLNSERFAVVAELGARVAPELSRATSLAANPGAVNGEPVGDGTGLPLGTGTATGIKLAPVNNETVAVDRVVTGGDN